MKLKLIDTWNDPYSTDFPSQAVFDGTYLYVVTAATNTGRIQKIDPATMATVDSKTWSESTDWDGHYIWLSGSYIYSIDNYDMTLIRKISTSTLAGVWLSLAGPGSFMGLDCGTSDGSVLYCGWGTASGTVAKITKVNNTTGATISTWTGIVDQDRSVNDILWDGSYIYAVTTHNTKSKCYLHKIDISTMTTSSSVALPGGTYPYSMAGNTDYIYMPDQTTKVVFKIRKSVMAVVATSGIINGLPVGITVLNNKVFINYDDAVGRTLWCSMLNGNTLAVEDTFKSGVPSWTLTPSMTNDGTFIYCGTENSGPGIGQIYKFAIAASGGFVQII